MMGGFLIAVPEYWVPVKVLNHKDISNATVFSQKFRKFTKIWNIMEQNYLL